MTARCPIGGLSGGVRLLLSILTMSHPLSASPSPGGQEALHFYPFNPPIHFGIIIVKFQLVSSCQRMTYLAIHSLKSRLGELHVTMAELPLPRVATVLPSGVGTTGDLQIRLRRKGDLVNKCTINDGRTSTVTGYHFDYK
ncbi:hypothetical protein Q9233_015073 [Columba guinea]|nr:hypothetical protein Q9233_015073 [Columba guinea]